MCGDCRKTEFVQASILPQFQGFDEAASQMLRFGARGDQLRIYKSGVEEWLVSEKPKEASSLLSSSCQQFIQFPVPDHEQINLPELP